MTQIKYLQVKNWEEFQHYKDRNPPWIKLSTHIFQDYEFGCLQDASKLLAICSLTLASRYKDPKLGLVPNDFEYIKRQGNFGDFVKQEHLEELITTGFLVDASNLLADCYQNASPETETETETETEKELCQKTGLPDTNSLLFEQFWEKFPKNQRSKGSRKDASAKLRIALKKDSFEKIIEGVRNYSHYLAQTGQSNQDAWRWLEKERWRDDYTVPAQNAGKNKPSIHNLEGKDYRSGTEGFDVIG